MPKTKRQKVIDKLDDLIRTKVKETYPEQCVTCGKCIGWFHPTRNPYGLQIGHYVSRNYKQLRWDMRNVHPQCSACNYRHNTDPAPYSAFMVEKYGVEIFNELMEIKAKAKRDVKPISVRELEELYDKLK